MNKLFSVGFLQLNLPGDTLSVELLIGLLVTLGIGILMGLEREFSRRDEKLLAGIRTYPLITLWGFLAALLSAVYSPWLFTGSLIGLLALVGISYVVTARNGDIGATSEISVVLAFLLGGLVHTGRLTLAIGIAVVVTALLSLKLQFHSVVGRLSLQDIYALLKFIVISVLILPFLPDTQVGPYPFLVPRDIWLVVVLVAAVGFAGYLLAKFIGARQSIVLTALLGSLVSSTAVTMQYSVRSKAAPASGRDYAAGIIFASSVMFLRVLAIIFFINRDMFLRLLVPLLACAVAGGTVGIVLLRRQASTPPPASGAGVSVENPLDLIGALKFGAIYLAILFFVHFIRQYAGTSGVYIAGIVSGLTDVDAISISMSQLAGETLSASVARTTIVLATLSNSIVKYTIALFSGHRVIRGVVSVGFGAIIIAGVLGLIIVS